MKAAKHDVNATHAIMIRDLIGPICVCDVDLNHDEVRVITQIKSLHVFILNCNIEVRIEVCSEGGQSERREQGIFDRTPIWACCLRQCRKNELHTPN